MSTMFQLIIILTQYKYLRQVRRDTHTRVKLLRQETSILHLCCLLFNFIMQYRMSNCNLIFVIITIFTGQKPVRNRNHIPSSDGCGSLGIEISTEYLPIEQMTKCCDNHDICYDTCNSGKEVCDLEFKRCLYNYCDTYKSVNVGGETITKGMNMFTF